MEWSFESLCIGLSKSTNLPLEWVREQIAMDDDILNMSKDTLPHIAPNDWINEWKKRHPYKKKVPKKALLILYFAYSDFLSHM